LKPIYVGLYEESGIQAQAFADLGYECHCFDIDQSEIGDKVVHSEIFYHEVDLLSDAIFDIVSRADFVAGFPPCTDLAVSGTAHWAKKKAINPNFQEDALVLVKRVQEIADAYDCPFYIENPKGVITRLWKKWDFRFHPYEFSAYCDSDDEQDCYTKETFLWTGNGFIMPEVRVCSSCITPNKGSIRDINAKGDIRRRLRSKTPRGFSQAVAVENMK